MLDLSLYVITAEVKEKKRTHYDVAKGALEGGATVIQFRKKNCSSRELFKEALKLRDLTAEYHKPLIINDRLDIALAVEADGVHLGWDDLPFEVAQKFSDKLKVIGLSVRNLTELKLLIKSNPSYFGAGPVFPTLSKEDATKPFGIKELKEIVGLSPFPVVAIGGINYQNLDKVFECGVAGVAVISAIAYSDDITAETLKFKKKIKSFREANNELVRKN